MKRNVLRLAVTAIATVGVATVVAVPASATHYHHIQTPGTCVDKHGQGFGTDQDHSHPGSFHARVHTGHGFAQAEPVSAAKGAC